MGGRVQALVVGAVLVGALVFASALFRRGSEAPARDGAAGAPTSATGGRVRVEVLNAGGTRGAARDATELLRRRGFDVVYFGNADSFGQDSSVVLDRVGRLRNAQSVAEALGIPNVRSEPDPNLYLDVSVRLGREWRPIDAAPRASGGGSEHEHP